MATPTVHLGDIQPRNRFFSVWERQRNKKEVHWFAECFAEALGAFFYVYAGLGSVCGFVVGNILKIPNLSSVFQIGFSYALGITFACAVCGATSGAHFNPCITISYVVYRGFPPAKALRYIFSQILGAYLAALFVYTQWKFLIKQCEAILEAAGTLSTTQYTPNGPAGIFALSLLPGQSLGLGFLNEFITDTLLGLLIWGCIDPSNPFCPPVLAPVLIGFGYAFAIWGFAVPGIALNTARDLGGRLAAITIWGQEAAGGRYAAISALTNVAAMLTGATLYEFFLADSDRVVTVAGLEFGRALTNHRRALNAQKETDARRQSQQVELHNIIELQSISENKPTEFVYAI